MEVHLSDLSSSSKTGDNDKRCVMEARLGGLQPITVSHADGSLEKAIDGATENKKKVLNRTPERLHDPRGRTPYGGDPTN